jgi:hypothetical protein
VGRAVVERRDHVWKNRSPCKFSVPVTEMPLYDGSGGLATALAGRDPTSVMVTLRMIRHVLLPTVRRPFTSIPLVVSTIPLAFSPMISSDPTGIVIFPSVNGMVCVINTFELAGITTSALAFGIPAPPHVVALFQRLSPAAVCGHPVRVVTVAGTGGFGRTATFWPLQVRRRRSNKHDTQAQLILLLIAENDHLAGWPIAFGGINRSTSDQPVVPETSTKPRTMATRTNDPRMIATRRLRRRIADSEEA